MICVDKIEETNVETANKIREEIKGIAHSFTCDVTKRDQIDDLHTRVSTEYRPCRASNKGGYGGARASENIFCLLIKYCGISSRRVVPSS